MLLKLKLREIKPDTEKTLINSLIRGVLRGAWSEASKVKTFLALENV